MEMRVFYIFYKERKVKKKFTRVLGVGLTLMLIASLMVMVVPASASSLSWYTESDVPKTDNYFLASGAEIVDLAVNGDVIYAATGTGTLGAFFGASADAGTATWDSTLTPQAGTYSAKIVHASTPAGGVGVGITPAAGITLADLNDIASSPEWSFYYNMPAGVSQTGPFLGLRFTAATCTDPDGAGHVDVTLMPLQNITTDGAWHKVTVLDTSSPAIAYGNKLADGTAFSVASTDLDTIEANINTQSGETTGAWQLTSVVVVLYEAGARTCYIDDITIAGVTYTLEDSILYKSTDAGKTWLSLNTATYYPTTKTIEHVAVARDDPDQVVASFSDNDVHYSSNGGSYWSDMGQATTMGDVFDIDIAPGSSRYVAVAGQNDANGADLFTMYLGLAGSWYARSDATLYPGFRTGHDYARAVAFSPNFATDKIITVVTGSGTEAYFQVFRYETGETKWNGQITFFDSTDWGTGGASSGGVAVGSLTASGSEGKITGGLTAASISLPETYLGTDEQERIAFVGITATTGSGVVRLSDTYAKLLTTWSAGDEGKINSVAYHDSGKLLAGAYDDCQVFYTTDPMASTPKFERVNPLKQPGGYDKVTVAWSGDTAVAGSQGDESAFAVSNDDGYSWNDISLIDTELDVMDDVAVSVDGSQVYLTTHDTSEGTLKYDASLWRKASSWQRVFSSQNVADANADFLVRLAPEDADVVYISSTGTTNMWVSKNSGLNKWSAIPCYRLDDKVQDFVVESADVVYAIDADECTKTINAGQSWGSEASLNGLTNAQTISLAPNGDVLVGGTGKVAFSKDAGASFTKITDVPGDSEPVFIVADPDYADNDIIYIAAGNEFERGTTDKTMSWSGREPTVLTGHKAKGIAEYEGVIYVLTANDTDSALYRALNLKTGANAALSLWSYFGTTYDLDFAPSALKMSSGPMFWAIDTAGNALVSITDPIATLAPTLVSPADGFGVEVNPGSGEAYNVTFIWKRYSDTDITAMDIEIATDSAFEGIVYEESFTGIDSDTIAKVIGPAGPSGQIAQFNPGDTYYWHVRVSQTTPSYSPWSKVRSFRVESPLKFALTSPTMGATGIGILPTFVWADYEGAIGYEIMVAEDPTFAVPDWIRTSSATFFKSEEALAYSTTYYWKVRGVTGEAAPQAAAPGGPWISSVFTTEAKPVEAAPPIVIGPTTPAEVQIVKVPVTQTIPAAIPSYLLWTIIGVGAVLFIALIVLIVRTRRVA